jgi:hypothetical protein
MVARFEFANANAASFLRRGMPRQRQSSGAGGQLLYLPATGITVLPYHRTSAGWQCALLLAVPHGTSELTATVTDLEVETAIAVNGVGPDLSSPAVFRQVWQARFYQYNRRSAAAEVIADHARDDRTLTIDTSAQRRLCAVTGLRPIGMNILLNKLVQATLLYQQSSPNDTAGARYTLALPPSPGTAVDNY